MNDDFRYIAAIAEHGSISRAARELHLSQPALSQRLRRVEMRLGCTLFDRDATPIRPTAPGEVYVKYALRAIAAEECMRREVSEAARGGCRRLRIGVSMTRADALLASPIAEFHETRRDCQLELRDLATIGQLHELFTGGAVDCAVLTPIAPDPALYDMQLLCHERLVVAIAPDLDPPQLKQAESGRIGISRLEGLPLALPVCGSYYDPLVDRLIEMSSAQLDIVVRGCATGLALAFAEDGLGAAIVPSTALVNRPHLRAIELDVQAGNALRYIRRRDTSASPDELAFMEILKAHL